MHIRVGSYWNWHVRLYEADKKDLVIIMYLISSYTSLILILIDLQTNFLNDRLFIKKTQLIFNEKNIIFFI